MITMNFLVILLIVPLIFSPNGEFFQFAQGGKRRIHITDDLDDVVDDEEDEAWKQWDEKPTPSAGKFDPPPSDFSNMNVQQIQEMMMKQHVGPVFGFVKLRLGVSRTADEVAEIAMKWTKILRTGAIEVKFMAVDRSTIMFTMQQGRDMTELKEFILKEQEAYEIKIGDQVFRRPGDPPLEEVVKKLQSEKDKADHGTASMKDDGHVKEEL